MATLRSLSVSGRKLQVCPGPHTCSQVTPTGFGDSPLLPCRRGAPVSKLALPPGSPGLDPLRCLRHRGHCARAPYWLPEPQFPHV